MNSILDYMSASRAQESSAPGHDSRDKQNPNKPTQAAHDSPVRVLDERLAEDDLVRDGDAAERVERDACDERRDGPREKDDGQRQDDAPALARTSV